MSIQLVNPTDLNAALGAIADAIRAKGGTSAPLTFSAPSGGNFPAAIASIPTGVPLPQLYAPTISLSGDTLTLTDATSNGAFTIKYEIYSDGVLKTTINKNSTFDLSSLSLAVGSHTITAKALNNNFVTSAASNGISYVVSDGYSLTIQVASEGDPCEVIINGTDSTWINYGSSHTFSNVHTFAISNNSTMAQVQQIDGTTTPAINVNDDIIGQTISMLSNTTIKVWTMT